MLRRETGMFLALFGPRDPLIWWAASTLVLVLRLQMVYEEAPAVFRAVGANQVRWRSRSVN